MTTTQAPILVKRHGLARVLGCSLRQVAMLEAGGILSPHARGKAGKASTFDLAVCVPAYLRHLQDQHQSGDGESLAAVRRRGVLARAQLLELRHERERGAVIPADVAAREAFTFARACREQILNVPSRLAAQLASTTDEARVFEILNAELRKALTATADLMRGEDAHA